MDERRSETACLAESPRSVAVCSAAATSESWSTRTARSLLPLRPANAFGLIRKSSFFSFASVSFASSALPAPSSAAASTV